MNIHKGQALITLLLFVIISVTVTTGAIIVILLNAKSTNQISQANVCHSIAESGIENAMLQLLRNPSYTGSTFTLDGGTTAVQVASSAGVLTITSQASLGDYQSTVQAQATYNNNVLSLTSWKDL